MACHDFCSPRTPGGLLVSFLPPRKETRPQAEPTPAHTGNTKRIRGFVRGVRLRRPNLFVGAAVPSGPHGRIFFRAGVRNQNQILGGEEENEVFRKSSLLPFFQERKFFAYFLFKKVGYRMRVGLGALVWLTIKWGRPLTSR